MDMTWITDILTLELGVLALGVFAIIFVVRQAAVRFKSSAARKIKMVFWKLAPIFPVLLGAGGAFLPGLFDGEPLGMKLLKGLIAGLIAPWARKVLNRFIRDKVED